MRVRTLCMLVLTAILGCPLGSLAAEPYAVAKKIVEGHMTYHLVDSVRHMEVGVAPDIGNFAYEFKVNGKDVLIPPASFKTYLENRKFCCGAPVLYPWANRIDQDYYYFEGTKYLLNSSLDNLRRDQFQQVIHGLLVYESRWRVVKTGATEAEGAFITSKLDFYRYPDLMAQFPFANKVEMTYRLKDGKLEATTKVTNLSRSNMPVMLSFHPYFRVDGPREDWTLSVGATKHWLLTDKLTPTGEVQSIENKLPGATNFKLGQTFLDEVFSNFNRDAAGLGHVSVKGQTQKIEVIYDQEFDFAVVYAPLTANLICIETQTGPTNAFNMTHKGKYTGLRTLKPGAVFKASYWVVPTGF